MEQYRVMNCGIGSARRVLGLCGVWLILLLTSANVLPAAEIPSRAPQWGIFEYVFKSAVTYTNPLEDVKLTVVFSSPLGDVSRAYGFWDGGRTWRVRFSPDMPGKWKFATFCSAATDHGLNTITGEFLCTAATTESSFDRHGSMRVARDHRHFEYGDHTPFLWLADTAWKGALLAKPAEWKLYAQTRSRQKFTVAQWVAAPGPDYEKQMAFSIDDSLKINLDFFRRQDAKITALNQKGILSAIVPLQEITSLEARHSPATNLLNALSEDQAMLLLRYMVARWGAYDVAWIIACDDSNASRWQRIGGTVFDSISHAPVIIFPGDAYWILDGFRAETWVNAFGYQTGPVQSEDSLQWLHAGPLTKDWQREPALPYINLAPPYENEPPESTQQQQITPDAMRHAVCWGLLDTPTAGFSYGAQGVWNWETNFDSNAHSSSQKIPEWQKNLLLPGAEQMATIATIFNSINFGKLQPAPELIALQPGTTHPARFISAAASEFHDLEVAYIPEDSSVELNSKMLPGSPQAVWINPRTGARTPIAIDATGSSVILTTPEAGDWLLLITGVPK